MAQVLLLHHAHGLTSGVRDWAGELQQAGHTVHLPDLYDGQVFDELEDGLAHAREIGFGTIVDRGRAAADALTGPLVLAGMSLGVLPAQAVAQTRPEAAGALLLHACLPPEELGGPWPADVPVQVHGMDRDPSFADEGDLDAARALVAGVPHGELFLYPGDAHLFTDASLPAYDGEATALLTSRVLALLATVDG